MEQIITEGDRFFATALRLIRNARESVYLDMYIFQDDEIGRLFRAALLRKARQGLRVHLVYDGVGSSQTPDGFWEPLRAAGVVVAPYVPLRRSLLPRGRVHTVWFWTWFKLFFLRRNHRKILICDDREALTGGFNIKRQNSRKYEGTGRWLDTMYRTDLPPIVRELIQIHMDSLRRAHWPRKDLKTWRRKRVREAILYPYSLRRRAVSISRKFSRRLILRILPSGHSVFIMSIPRALKRRIRKANRRIYLMFPYFVPYGGFIRLLARKARAGVDVRIYLSTTSDSSWIQAISLYQARKLHEDGVQVFLFHGQERPGDPARFNHSKVVLIDDWAGTGSSNFDSRSFQLNLEIFVLRYRPGFLEEVRRFFAWVESFSEPGDPISLPASWRARVLYPFRRFL